MQWGYVALPVLVLFAVIAVPVATADDASSGWVGALIVVAIVAIVGIVLIFSRMEVLVREGVVAVTFGFGWPRKIIDLNTATAVRRVRNRWWHGWGIRRVANGWMYNVWGLDAVELELATGSVFRIGTDEPDQLLGVLSLQVRG